MTLSIKRLFIYPVKSLRPVEVSAVELTNDGLRFDRSFVLVYRPANENESLAVHLTIKKVFKLILFQPQIDESWTRLTIKHTLEKPPSSVTVPLTPSPVSLLNSKSYQVSIFGTTAIGNDLGDEAASFFSHHLESDVRLVFIGGTGHREIPGVAYIPKQVSAVSLAPREGLQLQRIRFADAAPLLVTSSSSEEDLRQRLEPKDRTEDIILRLRPNIHIETGSLPPYDEDYWSTLLVHGTVDGTSHVTIKCIFKTVRCLSLNADPDTGAMIDRSRQLYGLLARDRRVNDKFPHKPVFGQYGFGGPSGAVLRAGDVVEVTERTD